MTPLDPEFREVGARFGYLPAELTAAALEVLHGAEPWPVRQEDYLPGYVCHPDIQSMEPALNRDTTFFRFSADELKQLHPMMEALAPAIDSCYESPWRVVNVVGKVARPRLAEGGPYAWHMDGMPGSIHKLLVYLTPAGPEFGTTELRIKRGETASVVRVEGPAGSWVLFRASHLYHRGVASATVERATLEITLAPALRRSSALFYSGMNAHYPCLPWTGA